MRIALIATCLGDALFPEVAKATTVLLERLLAQQKNSLLKQVGLLRPHHEDLPRRSLDHCAPSLSRTLSGIWRDSTRPKWVINGCR